jgi:Mg2+ and Co2+ transporter CorA
VLCAPGRPEARLGWEGVTDVLYRLDAAVATIFVPLTFVTRFFGMNFGWMIDHIDSPIAFWLRGIAIPIATAALSWRLFLRQFLMGNDPEARSC